MFVVLALINKCKGMGQIGISTWTGESGKKYEFADYDLDTVFNENVEGNYIFAKLGVNPGRITAIYIGEGMLKDRIEFRLNEGRVQCKGCDRVCVMQNGNKISRKFIEDDLLASNPDAYEPKGCNIRIGG